MARGKGPPGEGRDEGQPSRGSVRHRRQHQRPLPTTPPWVTLTQRIPKSQKVIPGGGGARKDPSPAHSPALCSRHGGLGLHPRAPAGPTGHRQSFRSPGASHAHRALCVGERAEREARAGQRPDPTPILRVHAHIHTLPSTPAPTMATRKAANPGPLRRTSPEAPRGRSTQSPTRTGTPAPPSRGWTAGTSAGPGQPPEQPLPWPVAAELRPTEVPGSQRQEQS